MAFPGTGKIWMNGKLVEWKDATIHIASHVIHYGSGVFEGARCYETPEGLGLLPARRAHAAACSTPRRSTGWSTRSTSPAGSNAVLETIRANEMKACYIRPLVYRGYDTLGVNPLPCPVDAAIMLWEWGAYLGQEALEQGVRRQGQLAGRAWRRTRCRRWPRARPTTRTPALIKMEAIADGYTEGIALDVYGNVSEGSGQNIFLVRDGVIYTPPLGSSILGGITRDSIMTLARDLGFTGQRDRCCRARSLYIADEVFFVGTAAEVTPIRSVDKITIGAGRRGPVTEALQRAFFDVDQRRGAGHARLADLRLPGGSGAAARLRRSAGQS